MKAVSRSALTVLQMQLAWVCSLLATRLAGHVGGGVVQTEVFNDGSVRINIEALILAAAVERDAQAVCGRAIDGHVGGRDLRQPTSDCADSRFRLDIRSLKQPIFISSNAPQTRE